ncbi:class E sortase [Dactylosporangium aurantiacum]|uniref:Class E sortase n=1 Tax=Dactylosporangium aurantiacum TaxID=35754 RepID=A0A9Q9IE40_9ACTN|nr:class E sortase [Dactylosporangium aurantiacum]MDG6108040.1 class E sortase [Dactylosporangium aurantiacum]UWZ53676.1 class E sortase [Dactylosporangium aurantiacum]
MGTGRGGDRTTRLLLLAAILLLASGVTAGGVTAWNWWGRVRAVHAAQERLAAEWARDGRRTHAGAAAAAEAAGRRPPAPMPFGGAPRDTDGAAGQDAGAGDGGPVALLHVPTLHLKLYVVEGSDEARLMLGPGRIPGTAAFGETGNTGIAGHRYPGVFWDLDELEVSAPVVVETRDTWLVYRVVDASVVQPEQSEVLAPPAPGAGPLLTLVTCEPKLSTARRLIRQATLVRRDPVGGPPPVELG